MRQISLFLIICSFYFHSNAKIEFNELIKESTEQQSATAMEVHRFAGVNLDKTPADYNIVVASETTEFNVQLKKLNVKSKAKKKNPASSRTVASEKNRVSKKNSKKSVKH